MTEMGDDKTSKILCLYTADREMKTCIAMAYLKWKVMVLLFLILSNTCSSNAANSYPTLVKDPTFWRNNEIPPHLSFKFNDGSQLRLLLANANDNPDFGFGFFTKGNNTNAFYLVVVKFMTFYDVPPIVVWSANRDEPVGEFATLELRDGDVVLRNEDGYIIWSTETPGSIARRLHVIDGGDLRLVDNRHTLIWNSFNHPTDVWIPGQVLGLKHVLTSSISNSNFSSGIFHLGVTIDSIRAYVDSDPLQIYRTIFPFHESNEFYNFSIGFLNYTSGSVKYQSSGGDFQYIRLEPNGHLNVYQLVDGYNQTLISNVLEDKQYGDCSYPEVCGTYGICSDGQCSCPESSGSYFRPSNSSLGSFECAQVAPLSCQDTGFVDLNNVTYFSFVPQLLFTNPENCKRECLKNCSCKAALFRYEMDISNGNCSLLTQMFSLMATGNSASDYNNFAFVKVQKSSERQKSLLIFILVPSVSAVLVLIILVASCYFYAKWRNKNWDARQRRKQQILDECSVSVSNLLRKFSFEDLKTATKDFDTELGKGGFGAVFAGILENGCEVAVKRLGSTVNQGKREFLAEVKTVGRIHHFNLVRLMGYCAKKSNRFLVYEYVSNGSLDKWIFNKSKAQFLTWEIRKKIIVGIAKGLEYLHHYCNKGIIHFDIKPQNILLDKDFNAKISDFGLAQLFDKEESHVSTLPRGTPGYIAPELIRGKLITTKIDVYSLGIVILEIICGRKNSHAPGDYLIDSLKNKVEENELASLVDESNEDMQCHKEDAVKVMEIAILCLQTNLYKRPTAAKVVRFLEGLTNVEPISDYKFLTMIHIDEEPVATPADACYISPITASVLSGPR